ncbi:MAG TPA: hypothetical protein VK453_29245 [Micromonosporaceae bacterium]|nr:hypothetical protein [Micromonosporaceae bacterium]
MNFLIAPPAMSRPEPPEPARTPREKEVDGFNTVLATILANQLTAALAADDHPRAVGLINRGFAEGSPQMGCALLCQAIAIVGSGRTWTVQIAPLSDRAPKARPSD